MHRASRPSRFDARLAAAPLHFHGRLRWLRSPLRVWLPILALMTCAAALLAHSVLRATSAEPKPDWLKPDLSSVSDAIDLFVTLGGVAFAWLVYVLSKRPNIVVEVEFPDDLNALPAARGSIVAHGFARLYRLLYWVGSTPTTAKLSMQSGDAPDFFVNRETAERRLAQLGLLNGTDYGLVRFVDGNILVEDERHLAFWVRKDRQVSIPFGLRIIVEGQFGDMFYRDYVFGPVTDRFPPRAS